MNGKNSINRPIVTMHKVNTLLIFFLLLVSASGGRGIFILATLIDLSRLHILDLEALNRIFSWW